MKRKLINMLELQNDMNSKVNVDWRSAGNEWYRAIWIESSEMLEHYGWKWWKKQMPDLMQVKLEVVDIVHFALSIRLEQDSSLVASAATIADAFRSPVMTDDIKTTIELLVKQTLVDRGAHFSTIAGVMRHLDMTFDELYEIYVSKNVLNMFRQDNGYKEGTYLKIWHGREDNEHLASIIQTLNSNSADFKGDIYKALVAAYRAAQAA